MPRFNLECLKIVVKAIKMLKLLYYYEQHYVDHAYSAVMWEASYLLTLHGNKIYT